MNNFKKPHKELDCFLKDNNPVNFKKNDIIEIYQKL